MRLHKHLLMLTLLNHESKVSMATSRSRRRWEIIGQLYH